jgi:hypothetical protein
VRWPWLESPRVRCWRMPVSSASCALSLPGSAHEYFRAPPSSTMRNHAPFRYPLATSVWEGGNHPSEQGFLFLLINWESRIPYLGYVFKRKSDEFDWARFIYRTTISYNINSNRKITSKKNSNRNGNGRISLFMGDVRVLPVCYGVLLTLYGKYFFLNKIDLMAHHRFSSNRFRD